MLSVHEALGSTPSAGTDLAQWETAAALEGGNRKIVNSKSSSDTCNLLSEGGVICFPHLSSHFPISGTGCWTPRIPKSGCPGNPSSLWENLNSSWFLLGSGVMSTSTLREILTEAKVRADLGERETGLVVHRQLVGPLFTPKVAGHSLYTLVC